MLVLDRSTRLTVWGNSALLGHTSPDEAADEVRGSDAVHRIETGEGDPVALTAALGVWRRAGVTGLRLSLPADRDLVADAVEAGGAVLAVRADGQPVLAYVPEPAGRGVLWRCFGVERLPSVPTNGSLAEHERALRAALREATEALVTLEVARWRDDAGQLIELLRDGPEVGLAPGYTGRAQRVAAQARRLRAVVALALEDEGGALLASEVDRRRRALSDVDRAARSAEMAACASILEPAEAVPGSPANTEFPRVSSGVSPRKPQDRGDVRRS